uniref:(northern house mosquito) hypothetical protein n=1 Tax=Culex pipiens TaxID=7175 RepID=A0A8D8IFB9_CULPI
MFKLQLARRNLISLCFSFNSAYYAAFQVTFLYPKFAFKKYPHSNIIFSTFSLLLFSLSFYMCRHTNLHTHTHSTLTPSNRRPHSKKKLHLKFQKDLNETLN